MAEAGSDEHERNLELLHEATAAYNRGDLGVVLQRAADDIVVVNSPGLVNPGTFHGREGFETWMRDWQEAWSSMVIDVREVTPVGERFLLVDVHQKGEGAVSGIEVEMDVTQLIEIRDGQIARFELHPTHEEALASLEALRGDAD